MGEINVLLPQTVHRKVALFCGHQTAPTSATPLSIMSQMLSERRRMKPPRNCEETIHQDPAQNYTFICYLEITALLQWEQPS